MQNEYTIKKFNREKYIKILSLIKNNNINTICMDANCPNRYTCFSKGTATFLVLGNICTRNCLYCNIENKIPEKLDKKEPEKISKMINLLKLKYVVLTSVSRDDLIDEGTSHFKKTIKKIKKQNSNIKIETLIPDFNFKNLKNFLLEKPDVLNHNIETVRDIFKKIRPKGDYDLSLNLLKKTKQINKDIITKSGLILGFGETKEQIIETFNDLRRSDCDILTIGQYFSPSKKHFKVKKYYTQKEFANLKKIAINLGFLQVESGIFVRSSFNSFKIFKKAWNKKYK